MKYADFDRELEYWEVTTGMNQRYHQRRQLVFAWWDRGVRIGVGVVTAFGFLCTTVEAPYWLSVGLSFCGLCIAIAVIVTPFVENSLRHAELFRRWTDLRADAELLRTQVPRNKSVGELECQTLQRIIAKANHIEGDEPAPNHAMLKECLGDEMESRFNVRTWEEREGIGKSSAA